MFSEPEWEVQRWLSGDGGVGAPGLAVALPYLPPFVSSLDTLSNLLDTKEHLCKMAFMLLPPPKPTPSPGPDHLYRQTPCCVEASDPMDDPEATAEGNMAAVRELVAKQCAVNPAYQMLKARFLSCFTLPALLATIKPCKEDALTTARQANTSFLQEGEGLAATHFTGITTRRPLETKETSQHPGQDSSQATGKAT
ncbi:hypothetical protein CRUP_033494, partial [Coryphaenoides rupestris]